MTKLQAIRKFADYVAQEHVYIYRSPDDDWELSMCHSKPHLGIPTHLMSIDELDKMYRAFFVENCPMAQGFSHVTLSILHEIGHHFNREIFIFDTDMNEYQQLHGTDHFTCPCEWVATKWAIDWLQDKEHRRIAKDFEKHFFGHA